MYDTLLRRIKISLIRVTVIRLSVRFCVEFFEIYYFKIYENGKNSAKMTANERKNVISIQTCTRTPVFYGFVFRSTFFDVFQRQRQTVTNKPITERGNFNRNKFVFARRRVRSAHSCCVFSFAEIEFSDARYRGRIAVTLRFTRFSERFRNI